MRLHFFNDVANDAKSTQKSKITLRCLVNLISKDTHLVFSIYVHIKDAIGHNVGFGDLLITLTL